MANEDPTTQGEGASKIRHPKQGFAKETEGGPATPAPLPPVPKRQANPEPEPVPMAESSGISSRPKTITAFGKLNQGEKKWARTPNATGKGAIHVKTFHAKLTADALDYMDEMINEWLDAHEDYEVKFVNSTVGILTGKMKEPHLICQVWV